MLLYAAYIALYLCAKVTIRRISITSMYTMHIDVTFSTSSIIFIWPWVAELINFFPTKFLTILS